MKKQVIFIFLNLSLVCHAQFLDTIKSVTKKRPSIDIRLESRHSFISNGIVKVSGVRLGLIFQKKLKVGIGYSWLNSDVSQNIEIINSEGKKQIVKNYLEFNYGALYTDFVFYKENRWQLSVPLQLGVGTAWFQHTNSNVKVLSKKHFLLLYEPGISVQYKLVKWFGVGADIGYRFTLKNTQYVGDKLNSPAYAFKLLFWFDQLFYTIAPKHQLTKKYGPATW